MADGGDEFVAGLRTAPGNTALLSDFDGTLAPIVADPALARPTDGAALLLGRLAAGYATTAIVSGRPLTFLESLELDPAVGLVGLYGLERRVDGVRSEHPAAGRWRPIVTVAAERARDELGSAPGGSGLTIENKDLSLTLHFRQVPALETEVEAWARAEQARSGLVARPARMSVELHPPIAVDKGDAVRELAAGRSAVAYLGDDRGDLSAFDALDELGRSGVFTVRVAVGGGAESPSELVERADLVLADPSAAAGFLRRLLV